MTIGDWTRKLLSQVNNRWRSLSVGESILMLRRLRLYIFM